MSLSVYWRFHKLFVTLLLRNMVIHWHWQSAEQWKTRGMTICQWPHTQHAISICFRSHIEKTVHNLISDAAHPIEKRNYCNNSIANLKNPRKSDSTAHNHDQKTLPNNHHHHLDRIGGSKTGKTRVIFHEYETSISSRTKKANMKSRDRDSLTIHESHPTNTNINRIDILVEIRGNPKYIT
jgi:hypothetical protein